MARRRFLSFLGSGQYAKERKRLINAELKLNQRGIFLFQPFGQMHVFEFFGFDFVQATTESRRHLPRRHRRRFPAGLAGWGVNISQESSSSRLDHASK